MFQSFEEPRRGGRIVLAVGVQREYGFGAARAGFRIGETPVPTLYNAPGSHIHPLRDTLRFIRLVLRHIGR